MVGSNLIEKYINKNVIIVGIDNLKLGKFKFIKHFLNKKNFFFYRIDLSKKIKNTRISKILKTNYLSEVWHLAANSDIQQGANNNKVDTKDTYMTTIRTLSLIKNYLKKDTKFIFSSSSAIYGNIRKSIVENHKPKKPVSNYGIMKLKSEKYIENFSKKKSLKAYIFRFPNVVGKNLTHGIIFDFINKIKRNQNILNVLGNGNQQKPYSDVSEIIRCMIYIKNLSFKNYVNYFNIGTRDKGIKVKEIVNIFIKNLNFKITPVYQNKKKGWKGDVINYKYSTKKINRLGFNFKLNSKEVIEKTVKNYLKKVY